MSCSLSSARDYVNENRHDTENDLHSNKPDNNRFQPLAMGAVYALFEESEHVLQDLEQMKTYQWVSTKRQKPAGLRTSTRAFSKSIRVVISK